MPEVISPRWREQAPDLTAFSLGSPRSGISAGKTAEFAETIFLMAGHILYSSPGKPMLQIVGDIAGCHDILLAPCSQETFDLLYHERRDRGDRIGLHA